MSFSHTFPSSTDAGDHTHWRDFDDRDEHLDRITRELLDAGLDVGL